MRRGGQSYKWEYEALANDDYYVWIKAGDPYVGEDRQFKIYAEGETIIDGTITSDNRWLTGSVVVRVEDEELTIHADDDSICTICTVMIARMQIDAGKAEDLPLNYGMDIPGTITRGNLLEDSHFTYAWTPMDRPSEITDKSYNAVNPVPQTVRYLYDAMGRRVATLYSDPSGPEWKSFITIYDGVMPVEEIHLDGSGLRRRFYYENGINKLVRVEYADGSDYVPLTDDRGTVMGVVDVTPGSATNGKVIERLYYNSTGLCKSYRRISDTVYEENLNGPYNVGRSLYVPFGWCGMYRDEFTGKYHTHFRDYDPIHARWLCEDPAGYMDGLNLYNAYMGVNGIDPLGLEINEEDLRQAYFKLFGENDPLWNAFTAAGNTIETADVLSDLDVEYRTGDVYNLEIEEDIDLATASMLMRSGMMKVLGQSLATKNAYLDKIGFDAFASSEAHKTISRLAFKEAASDAATIANIYISSLGILNEGVDIAMSVYDLADGHYSAVIGLLPVVPGSVGRIVRKSDALDPIDASKIRLVTAKNGHRYLGYVDKGRRWSNFEYAVHQHHVFFTCLGGSDEAANILSMQMLIHNRQGIGLHQHLAKHMGMNYEQMVKVWKEAKMAGRETKQLFIDDLYEGYSTFFKGASDYNEVMDIIGGALDEAMKLK